MMEYSTTGHGHQVPSPASQAPTDTWTALPVDDTPDDGLTPREREQWAEVTAWSAWQMATPWQRVELILAYYTKPEAWLDAVLLDALAAFRADVRQWAKIKAMYKAIGGTVRDLDEAATAWLATPSAVAQRCVPHAHTPTQAQAPSVSDPWHLMTAQDLHATDLPPLAYVVEDLLPIGATLFVGRAKDGKSLAMWNLCLAVSEGGLVFGRYRAQQGRVLYLALEDGERRAKKRLLDQMQAAGMTEPPAHLDLVLWEAPRLGEGLEDALQGWLDQHGDARLIVVDILEKVRPRRTAHGSVYQEDYGALAPLQRLAQERGIALVVVHHTNKAKADDFRDAISGSTSLGGAADTIWVLQHLAGEADAALRVTGRDLDTQAVALQFRDGFWTALGAMDDYTRSKESREVLEALQEAGKPMTPKQLAGLLGVIEGTMRVRLVRMAERGELLNLGDGRYVVRQATPACTEDVTPVTHVTPVTVVTPDAPVVEVSPPPGVILPLEDLPPMATGDVVPEEVEAFQDVVEDVTSISPAKDKGFGEVGDSVTAVTGVTHLNVAQSHDQVQRSTNGHTHGHSNGHRPSAGVRFGPHERCRHLRISSRGVCRDCGALL